MTNTNFNVKNQGRKKGEKVRFCTLLAPYRRALGRSAQVGRKLSHEQNRLMRTKVRPALGKTTLMLKNFPNPPVGVPMFCLNPVDVETGTSLYVGPTRLTKLVHTYGLKIR